MPMIPSIVRGPFRRNYMTWDQADTIRQLDHMHQRIRRVNEKLEELLQDVQTIQTDLTVLHSTTLQAFIVPGSPANPIVVDDE